MKKTVVTCVALIAVFALAGTAGAITCTTDQHPAATLLVPYFQVSYDASGALVPTGIGARDTIVTIVNASAAPMIAHVSVFDRFSTLQLDFNVALSPADVQPMRVSDILAGNLPTTLGTIGDVCQKASSDVYPTGYLRVIPVDNAHSATPLDNQFATTAYNTPAFDSAFSGTLIHNLRIDCNKDEGPLAIGYITIDMANYCNLSDPTDFNYYNKNAIGMENNMLGDIIFTSGFGLPTYAMSTVNIEADYSFGNAAFTANIDQNLAEPFLRTFYARYWQGFTLTSVGTSVPVAPGAASCVNCSLNIGKPCPSDNALDCVSPWNVGMGDQREPLATRYASRWIDLGTNLTSNFQVWRASNTSTGGSPGDCNDAQPVIGVAFIDEDENVFGTAGGYCFSPPGACATQASQFPDETQQRNITIFQHGTATGGWVTMDFSVQSVQSQVSLADPISQAFVGYTFEGSVALESTLVPATSLDPSACNPLGFPAGTVTLQVDPVVPQIPTGFGP